MKIRPVLILFLLLLVLLHSYIGLRLLPWLPFPAQLLGGLMLATSCLLMPMVPRFWRTDHPLLIWLSTLSMGFFSWLLVLSHSLRVAPAQPYWDSGTGKQARLVRRVSRRYSSHTPSQYPGQRPSGAIGSVWAHKHIAGGWFTLTLDAGTPTD